MSSIFRKIEEPKCFFCQRSLVSEQGRVAFSGHNGSLTALVVILDQELLLQLLTITFSPFALFNWKLIDKINMVKTLFKCCKQGHFYQRLSINRTIAEYDNKLEQNGGFLHYRTPSLNKFKKTYTRFYFSKITFFMFFKIVLKSLAEVIGFVLQLT